MIRIWLTRTLCALFVACLLAPAIGAGKGGKQNSDIQNITEHGRIDWTHGALYATGLGAVSHEEPNQAKAYLRARGFAKLDALRNMLMVIDHVHIDAHTVGADYETQDDTIRAEVEGIVKGAQVISERKIKIGKDMMVEVTVSTHMYGEQSVASVFLPEEIRRSAARTAPPADTSPAPSTDQPAASEPSPQEIAPASEDGSHFTSVIIDARGFRIERSMAPKIKRRDGSEIWGTVAVDPDYVIDTGIVLYTRSLSDARQLARAGNHPLELRALGNAGGPMPSDPVLSDADGERLLRIGARDGFLKKFNVIFVVDPAH